MNKLRNVVQIDEGYAGTLSEITSSFLTKPKKPAVVKTCGLVLGNSKVVYYKSTVSFCGFLYPSDIGAPAVPFSYSSKVNSSTKIASNLASSVF